MLGKEQKGFVRALLNSGASKSVIGLHHVKKLFLRKEEATKFQTAHGTFSMSGRCRVKFILPEISLKVNISHEIHVHSGDLGAYNMILGRDLLSSLVLDTCFSDGTFKWPRMQVKILMKPYECTVKTLYHVEDPMTIQGNVDVPISKKG